MITKQDDVKMINSPDMWPLWPVLPMKNRTLKSETEPWGRLGLVFANNLNKVYLMSLDEFHADTDLSVIPNIEYASAEAMVGAGWLVD